MVLLTEVTRYVNIYGFFIVLIFGTVGNLLNLITFPKDFRTIACIFYLTCTCLVDLLFINFGIILRLTTEYLGPNLTLTNRSICKTRAYFLVCLPIMASTSLLLATFDRCVSTSPSAWWRRLSSMRFAKLSFIVTMLFVLITSIFHIIIFDLRNGTCAPLPGLQSIMVAVYANVFAFVIPDIGTLLFGITTWIHINQSKKRITPISGGNQRIDRQLVILIFVQASVSAVLDLQRCITYSYNVLTSSVQKSVERQQIEYVIIQLSTLIYYTNFGMTFYINYGSSSLFRKTFRKSIGSLVNRCSNLNYGG
ncbi:hypothetical protein I4U23_004674 [Adineta vaga]|nr:hypothetical protein I4U23_004674 [Adineta vaga]